MILIKRTYINPEHVVAVEYEVDGYGYDAVRILLTTGRKFAVRLKDTSFANLAELAAAIDDERAAQRSGELRIAGAAR